MTRRRDRPDETVSPVAGQSVTHSSVGGDLIQVGGDYHAAVPVAGPTFPQFVNVPDQKPLIGREDELAQLAQHTDTDQAVVIAQAATGLGGVGKTALAAEYCHRHRHLDVVRWLNADNRATLEAHYLRMGSALGLNTHGLDPQDQLAWIRSWFERTDRRWLLVFDNADTPAVLYQLLPTAGRGQVLITSRHRDWSITPNVNTLPLGVLEPEPAVELLCRLANRRPDDDASALIADLGGLALAIEQAGAFLRGTGWTFRQYREHLVQRAAELLARDAAGLRHLGRDDVTVMAVWDTSLERAAEEAEGAGTILGVLAYLAADLTPRTLLLAPNAAGENDLRCGDELYVDEAVASLDRYSLLDLTRVPNSGEVLALSVHRLVQHVTRLRHQAEDSTADRCGLAVRLLKNAFPSDASDPRNRTEVQRLESHLLVATEHAREANCELELVAWLLGRYGFYLKQTSTLTAASSVLTQAIELANKVWGADHADTLYLRNALADSYSSAGLVEKAIEIEQRLLADYERVLGVDHPTTLYWRGVLALSYNFAGRVEEAIELGERVLADSERVLGEDHSSTLAALDFLASSYDSATRHEEAIALEQRVLVTRERILGVDDPRTLEARSNLADSYGSARRFGEAIALEERVVADSERILGVDHPRTLAARIGLARSYGSADRLGEAIALGERVVDDSERILGATHWGTLDARNSLVSFYLSADRFGEAIALGERVVDDCERILGATHWGTVTAVTNLFGSYRSAGRIMEAIAMEERLLAILERVYGTDHRITLVVRSAHEQLLRDQTG